VSRGTRSARTDWPPKRDRSSRNGAGARTRWSVTARSVAYSRSKPPQTVTGPGRTLR